MNFKPPKSPCDWSHIYAGFSHSNEPSIKEAVECFFRYSDAEHPDAWVDCGTDDGPFYILTIFRARRTWNGRQFCDAIFQKYDNQDMNKVIEERELGTFSKRDVVDLWKNFVSVHMHKS